MCLKDTKYVVTRALCVINSRCCEPEIYTCPSRSRDDARRREEAAAAAAASLRGIKWILYERRDDADASWNKQLKVPSDDVDTSRGES